MKNRNCTLLALALLALAATATPTRAQSVYTPYAFTNFAGLAGFIGTDDGTGDAARFRFPDGAAVDGAGNVYVVDTDNHLIRQITPAGEVTTLAGGYGDADGVGMAARFRNPKAIAIDSATNLYVADTLNFTIRKITPTGTDWVVTTIAGVALQLGSADGTGDVARFSYAYGIAADSAGSNIYVADSNGQTIRHLTPDGTNWVVTTIAGSFEVTGSADGVGSTARFRNPRGIAADSAGNVYVSDISNQTIRKLTPTGTNWMVTTLAGSAGVAGSADGTDTARFTGPKGIAVDGAGNIYVTEAPFTPGGRTIRHISPVGEVTTLAGSAGVIGSDDGIGSAAQFSFPSGIAVDSAGNLYVADTDNHRITKGTFVGPLAIIPPAVRSAARDFWQATVVTVVFSEPVSLAPATNVSNYTINNGGTISGASLTGDGRSVVLTTSPLSDSVTNILTVNNVQDVDGNSIAPNTQVTISVASDTIRAQYSLDGTNELVVLEAEHYNLNTPGGGSSWIFTTAPPLLSPTDVNTNFSGDGALLADPNTGRNVGSPAIGSVPPNSPSLDFKVQFTNTGTFYVWVRGVGDSTPGPSADDSVLVGANGALAIRITGFPLGQGYAWGNATAGSGNGPIVITNAGLHAINVWMREDGFTVDKILLTSDSGFTPTDLGPAESPVVVLVRPTIAFRRSGTDLILSWPGGGTLQSSTNVVGPYVDIPGSSSPFTIVPTGAQQYFRVRQ